MFDVLALHFKIVHIPNPMLSLTLPSLVWIPLNIPRENTPSVSVSEYSYFVMQHSGFSSLLQTFNCNIKPNTEYFCPPIFMFKWKNLGKQLFLTKNISFLFSKQCKTKTQNFHRVIQGQLLLSLLGLMTKGVWL